MKLSNFLPAMESCSACGQCLPACPVYAQSGLETDAPAGKLRIALALARGGLKPAAAVAALGRCMLCGRCARACPQQLPLQEIFFAARRQLGPHLPASRKALVWSLARAPLAWDFCQPPLHLLQGLISGPLPRVAFNPFTSRERGQGNVLLFGGCLSRRFFPELIADSIRALEANGYSVIWDAALVCCGRPRAAQGGDISAAVAHNLRVISRYEFEFLTSPCPGCLAAIRSLWQSAPGLKKAEAALCGSAAAKCADITVLLDRAGARCQSQRIFWHSPCLLDAKAEEAALRLLGEDVASSPEPACCGAPLDLLRTPKSAKRPNALLKPASLPLRDRLRKAALAQAVGCELIATACPGCMLALAGAVPVRHVAQIYAQGCA
ncbi:MAG: (Fe-S)-binding protein [Desulfovibrio sp.]|nr:(Fe-S)-binding protein [Desulfovibrio sp.]